MVRQILISRSMQENYAPGSYTTFGNDGMHFGDSINAGTNTAVSAEMANALHAASDHLPVYLDLVFKRTVTSVRDGKDEVLREIAPICDSA